MPGPRRIDPCAVYDLDGMAEVLDVSTKWLRAQTFERKLPAVKLGRAWAFVGSAVIEHLAAASKTNLQATPATRP